MRCQHKPMARIKTEQAANQKQVRLKHRHHIKGDRGGAWCPSHTSSAATCVCIFMAWDGSGSPCTACTPTREARGLLHTHGREAPPQKGQRGGWGLGGGARGGR